MHHIHRSLAALASLLVVTTLIGCNVTDDSPPLAPTEARSVIMPLRVGNVWWYSYRYFNSVGVEAYGRSSVSEVVDSVWLNGARWFVVEEDSGYHGVTHYNRNTSNGLHQYETDSMGELTPFLIFKYPAVIGDTYPRLGLTVTLTDTDSSVTVPAGTFSCHLYEGEGFRQYVLPDTGIIRVEFDVDMAIGATPVTLLRYDLDSLRLQ